MKYIFVPTVQSFLFYAASLYNDTILLYSEAQPKCPRPLDFIPACILCTVDSKQTTNLKKTCQYHHYLDLQLKQLLSNLKDYQHFSSLIFCLAFLLLYSTLIPCLSRCWSRCWHFGVNWFLYFLYSLHTIWPSLIISFQAGMTVHYYWRIEEKLFIINFIEQVFEIITVVVQKMKFPPCRCDFLHVYVIGNITHFPPFFSMVMLISRLFLYRLLFCIFYSLLYPLQ